MGIQTKTTITCDECNEPIVANEATKTGYLHVENACPQNAEGEWATDLPPAIPAPLTVCGLDCLKAWAIK